MFFGTALLVGSFFDSVIGQLSLTVYCSTTVLVALYIDLEGGVLTVDWTGLTSRAVGVSE